MKNAYEIRGDVTAIFIHSPKYGDFEILIDSGDFHIADSHSGTWGVCKSNPLQGQFYVVTTVQIRGIKTTMQLARVILDINDQEEVFYTDKNTLNLRRCNITSAIMYKRGENRTDKHRSGFHSGVRGVHWCKQTKKWRSVVVVAGKYKNVGRFNTIQEAEAAIRKVRLREMTHSMMDKI